MPQYGYGNRADPAEHLIDGLKDLGAAGGAPGTGAKAPPIPEPSTQQAGESSLAPEVPPSDPIATPIEQLPRQVARVVKGELPPGSGADDFTTAILELTPTTQPDADPTKALLYLDEADDVIEIVMPDSLFGGRARVVFDYDEGSFPPDLYASVDLYGVAGSTAGRAIDGWVGRGEFDAAAFTFADRRSGVGNDYDGETPAEFQDEVATDRLIVELNGWPNGGGTLDGWVTLSRGLLSFDTTGLGPSPTSGTLRVMCSSKITGQIAAQSVRLVAYPRPDPDAAILPADYQSIYSVGGFAASDDAPLVSSFTPGVAYEFTLNAVGLAQVTTAGKTWFALRLSGDFSGVEPSQLVLFGSDEQIRFHSADAASQAQRPRLHLAFT